MRGFLSAGGYIGLRGEEFFRTLGGVVDESRPLRARQWANPPVVVQFLWRRETKASHHEVADSWAFVESDVVKPKLMGRMTRRNLEVWNIYTISFAEPPETQSKKEVPTKGLLPSSPEINRQPIHEVIVFR